MSSWRRAFETFDWLTIRTGQLAFVADGMGVLSQAAADMAQVEILASVGDYCLGLHEFRSCLRYRDA
jgi:hypothetical protein